MARLTLVVLVVLFLLVVSIEGGKKDKSDKGEKKDKKDKKDKDGKKKCNSKMEKTIEGCLQKGYQSKLDNCDTDKELNLKPKEEKKCNKADKKLKKCGFTCPEPETTPTPETTTPKSTTPEPTTKPNPGPKPESAKIVEECGREDINYVGRIIFNYVSKSVEDCVKDCLRTRSCEIVGYRRSDGRCYLKAKQEGNVGPTNQAGFIGMYMECDNSPVTNLNCMRDGVNFPGADIRNLIVADEKECVGHCRDTELCISLTFRKSDKRCYLKSKKGGAYGPTVDPNYKSMNMECDNSALNNLDCLSDGLNFPGADLRPLIVADESECVKHCRDTELCTSLAYRKTDRKCYLKSKRGGSSGPTLDVNYKSMNMECDNSPVTNLDCMRDGVHFRGADLRNLIVADESECVKHCRNTELCTSLTYTKSDRRCYLKSKKGGSSGPTLDANCKSMNMECDNSPVTNLDCMRDAMNFPGADIRNFIVANEEECVKQCRETELCISLSFRKPDKRCYLKSKKGGASGPTVDSNVKSMNMECDNSALNNLDCLRDGLNFNGADLRNLIVADESECVKHCRDTELCTSLTYRKTDRRCYLKSKRGGSSGPTLDVNYKSMNMECDNTPVSNLDCMRDGVNFWGADLRNNIVADENECVKQCRDTELCTSLTYRKTDQRCYLKSKKGGSSGPKLDVNCKSMNMECDNSNVDITCAKIDTIFPGQDINNLVSEDLDTCVAMCRDTQDCAAVSLNDNGNRCYLKRRDFEWWQMTSQDNWISINMELC